ncbi:segregation/condensation protein A [Nannocystis pusilla]|uniref:Segregation and condensation protein A n=1 Tax=Nannocystis pusilla TaxID=889268 RepID=A0A9X3ELX2_9BACT|nr:segregation/condensation protein A [Nannocystis pusilla]MCY1006422.1 segregation/condensation protein A [Nannocystis pusilla]
MEQGSTGLGEGGPRPRERKGAASPIYSVELEVFEGPLDLLLHLVRKHELDILDIPISFVAEKYLAYLDVMRQLDLEIAGDYLVMAATLAYLKSRELLPPEPRAGEAGQSEEEEGEDPREALIRRLVEYERFKQAAAELDSLPVSGRDVFARGAELVMPPIDPGLAPVSLFNLAEAYYRVLTRAKVKSTHEVQIEAVTVAQRIKQLALILDEKPHFEFEELFLNRTWNSERELRAMLVVTLMSILEMVKLGVAGVQQPVDSTAIRIYRRASAQETQQALADYDEDASFGAPKPKEGESPAPSAPKRPSEAELDAVEEAALLAEALASVQEPEEPVVGYSDEGENVAANDPASEYDDEPRPAPRRTRSEGRAARTDVLEDRDEGFDDEPEGRLVIVEGTSAEVPREHEGPRWGRRSGEEEPAARVADESGQREDVLEDMAALREDAGVGAEDVLEGGSEADASDATPRSESVLEDRWENEGPDAEDAREAAAAGEEARDAEDVVEDRSEADSEVPSHSSEREGEAVGVAADGGILDDALGDEGVVGGTSDARSSWDEDEDVLEVASTVRREFEDSPEGEPSSERHDEGDESESAGVVAGRDDERGLADVDDAESEPELSASWGEEPEGLEGRDEAFLPAVQAGAPERQADGAGSSREDARSSEVDAAAGAGWPLGEDDAPSSVLVEAAVESGERPRAALSTEDVRQDSSHADVDGLAETSGGLESARTEDTASGAGEAEVPGTLAHGVDDGRVDADAAVLAASAALPPAAAGDEAAGDVLGDRSASRGSEVAESPAATGDVNALEDRPAAEENEASEPAEARALGAGLTALGREASETASSAAGVDENLAADEVEATEPTDSAAEQGLEESLAADGFEASEPTSSAEERVLEDNSAADGIQATEPALSAGGEAAEDGVDDGLTPGEAESTVAAEDETEDVLEASLVGGAAATESTSAAGDETEDVLEASLMGGAAATESTSADGDEAEDVLEADSEGGVAATEPLAADDEATAEDVPGDSSLANGVEVALRDEVVEDVLGDSSATGELGASTAAGEDGAADDSPGERLGAFDSEAESGRTTEAYSGAAAEPDDVLADSQASGANEGEAAADVEASDTEDDESKPVRSDSDEDEAGGLFLNTGEGLGARELGDVDEDEDEGDAQ